MNDLKIVNFHEHCPDCQFSDIPDGDDPCNECLATPVNVDSRKPICFKEKE